MALSIYLKVVSIKYMGYFRIKAAADVINVQ